MEVIVKDIQTSCTASEITIGEVGMDIDDLCNDMNRVTEAVGRIYELEDSVKEFKSMDTCLPRVLKVFEDQAEDAKGWAHRNNLHFIGFLREWKATKLKKF